MSEGKFIVRISTNADVLIEKIKTLQALVEEIQNFKIEIIQHKD